MRNGLVIGRTGSHSWFYNDQLHRADDSPAYEYNGDKWWYQYGKRHRHVGPAVNYGSIVLRWFRWFVNGSEYTEDEFNNHNMVLMYRFINGQ